MLSKTKLFVFLAVVCILALFAILAYAVESDTWNCYSVGDDKCECVKNESGGEGLCLHTNGPLGSGIYYTREATDVPTVDWCEASMPCEITTISCYGANKCESWIVDNDTVKVRCDGTTKTC